MKIVVFGNKGWIGTQIVKILEKENHEIIYPEIRAENYNELEKFIIETNPDSVICSIGRTHGLGYPTIDYLEQPGKLTENIHDNLYAPLLLAQVTSKYNIHLTYIGTGCIFDGNDKNFSELDTPNFFGSSYSIVKGYTDNLMKSYKNVLNVRIRMPITSEKTQIRNFITKITTYDKVCSISNSMTVLPELLPILVDMIIKNNVGTINLTNPGSISHNEILEMYKEIVDNNFTWKNFTLEEQNNLLLSKRSNNILDTSKLEKLYPNVKNIKDSIKDILIEMKELSSS